ncbi:MAG: hypothetical protein ACYDER_15730 [Ktedonobacteraceae bacterium]
MMEHYSQRLGRNFQNSDWLTRNEVASVIETNSGRPVTQLRFVRDIAVREGWRVEGDKFSHILLYHYEDCKNFVLRRQSGRRVLDAPTPNTLRQRKLREKRQKTEEK